MSQIEVIDPIEVGDLSGVCKRFEGTLMIGVSTASPSERKFYEDFEFLQFLESEVAQVRQSIVLFEILEDQSSRRLIYFSDGKSEIFTEDNSSDAVDPSWVSRYIHAVLRSLDSDVPILDVSLEMSAWRMAEATTYSPGLLHDHFAPLLICRGAFTTELESEGSQSAFRKENSVIQFWLSTKSRKIAVCAVHDESGFGVSWSSLDLDGYLFETVTTNSGMVEVRLSSPISGFTCTMILGMADALLAIEMLANPMLSLKRCSDFDSQYSISTSMTDIVQRLFRLGSLQSRMTWERNQIREIAGSRTVNESDLGGVKTVLGDVDKWAEFIDSLNSDVMRVPASIRSVAVWIDNFQDEVVALKELAEELQESNSGSSGVSLTFQGQELANGDFDPLSDAYWYRASDMVYLRPIRENDPVAMALDDLPFLNKSWTRSNRFIDWTNSFEMSLSDRVSNSVFNLAAQLGRLNIEAIPTLTILDDLSVVSSGYGKTGMLTPARSINVVQIMARLSRHFRQSRYSYGIAVDVDGYLAIVSVNGDFYRGIRQDYVRASQDEQIARRRADYQAAAIRREFRR